MYQTANKFDIVIVMYCTAGICFGRVRRMRKATVSFAYLSIRMEQLASWWTDFYEISYLSFSENLWRKFEFH